MTTDEKLDFLIDFFKEFKTDVNKRMDRLEHNQERLQDKQEKMDDLLRDVWKSKDLVVAKVTFDFIWKAVAVNAVVLIGVGSFFFL